MQGLDTGHLHICTRCIAWSLCGSPHNWSGDRLTLMLTLEPLLLTGLPGWAREGEDESGSAGTRYPRMGWHPRGASPSLSTGSNGGTCKVGLGGKERGGL